MERTSTLNPALNNLKLNSQIILSENFKNIRFSNGEYIEAYKWYSKLDDQYFKKHQSLDELISLYNNLPEGFYRNYILKLNIKPGEEKYRLKVILNEIYKDITKYGNFRQNRFMLRFMKEYNFFPNAERN